MHLGMIDEVSYLRMKRESDVPSNWKFWAESFACEQALP